MSRYRDYSRFSDDNIIRNYHQDYREGIIPVWRQNVSYYAPSVVLLGAILFGTLLAFGIDIRLLPQLAWNVFVYFTPWRIIHIFSKELQAASGGESKTNPNRSFAEKSATMKRIIGMDKPGNLAQSVAQAGRRRLSLLPGVNNIMSKRPSGGPPGLGNWDNSCYQNSVLQGLASLDDMSDYLKGPLGKEGEEEGSLDESPQAETQMANSLKGLIQKLNDPVNNGTTLWTPQALKSMSSWTQQDAQEYFSNILDSIDKEFKKAVQKEKKQKLGLAVGDEETADEPEPPKKKARIMIDNMIEPLNTGNPLEGLQAQRVGCTVCGHSSGLSMNQFNCITMPLRRGQIQVDLSECLDEFASLEPIQGVQCGKCTLLKTQKLLDMLLSRGENADISERLAMVVDAIERDDYEDKTLAKCKIPEKNRVKTTKSRQAVIARPPKSLVLHINRSMFNEMTGHLVKNNARVNFDKTFDLGPWCLGSVGRSTNDPVDDEPQEAWILNPQKSMIAGSRRESLIMGPRYELKAIVTHQGHHENGHYIAYRRMAVPDLPAAQDTTTTNSGEDGDTSAVELDELKQDKEPKQKYNWYRLSDDDVDLVSEETVLNQGGVFMLFYDLIAPAQRMTPEMKKHMPAHEASGWQQLLQRRAKADDEEDDIEPEKAHGEQERAPMSAFTPGLRNSLGAGGAQDMVFKLMQARNGAAAAEVGAEQKENTPSTEAQPKVENQPIVTPPGMSASLPDEPKVVPPGIRSTPKDQNLSISTSLPTESEANTSQPSSATRSRHTSTADSDGEMSTSAASSPPLTAKDEALEPVRPIVIKPYQGRNDVEVEKTERSKRDESGGLLMT